MMEKIWILHSQTGKLNSMSAEKNHKRNVIVPPLFMYLCFSFYKHCTVLLLVQFCIRWFSIQTKNVHFSLFWGGWKYCQSFVKPDHLLVKCLSLTWKTFASISSEQRIVKLHWDIEYGFCLKNMIKTTKCKFYSLGFILIYPFF